MRAFTGKNTSATAPTAIARATGSAPGGGVTSGPGGTTAPPAIGQPASIRFARNTSGASFVFRAASCTGPSGDWKGSEVISGPAHGTINFGWDFSGGTSAPLTANGRLSFPQGAVRFSGNHFSGSTAQGVSVSGTLNVTAKLVGGAAKPAIAFASQASTTVSFLGITRTGGGSGGSLSLPIRSGSAPGY